MTSLSYIRLDWIGSKNDSFFLLMMTEFAPNRTGCVFNTTRCVLILILLVLIVTALMQKLEFVFKLILLELT